MANILIGTDWVGEDEPCLKLWEEESQAPDNSGHHRYRVFRVLRGNRVVEFREDLGTSDKFKDRDSVVLWTGIIDSGVFWGHRVGEAREMLDQYQHHVHFDKLELVGVDKINLW